MFIYKFCRKFPPANQQGIGLIALLLVLGVIGTTTGGTYYYAKHRDALANSEGSVQALKTVEWNSNQTNTVANQDGSAIAITNTSWIGTGANTSKSYLGIVLSGSNLPSNANIVSAKLAFMSDKEQWINTKFNIFGDKNGTTTTFSASSNLANIASTQNTKAYSENTKWLANTVYMYDVTDVFSEIVKTKPQLGTVTLVAQGKGAKWSRKTFFSTQDNSPKLLITYSEDVVSTPTPTPTPTPTSTPTVTPTPTPTPTSTPTPTPSSTPSVGIWGIVSADTLGTCTAAIHDRYVTTGDDGKLYRTWHPQTVPVNAADPSGTKCTFAHEHGDDPSTAANSEIKNSPVVFGYIGRRMTTSTEPNGHEEAHEGFKVFVANKGMRNNEGRTNLHDSRIVFHMGTGGVKRYDTQFHSMEYKVITNDGRKMFVQGMGDTGGVGNICANPRQGKTVMTLDPSCKVDSLYEIWENKLRIRNSSNRVIATAITSTAVFDPLSVMDPSNHTRLVNTWSSELNASLNFPNNDRTYVRSCDREAYHGPTYWENSTNQDVFYTDSMGMEMAGGDLKQIISKHNTGGNFKATDDGLAQFKYRRDYCANGLGLKN